MTKRTRDQAKELAEELDTFDDMFSTLVELLEKKGIITQNEYENALSTKIDKKKNQKSYRDIQFHGRDR